MSADGSLSFGKWESAPTKGDFFISHPRQASNNNKKMKKILVRMKWTVVAVANPKILFKGVFVDLSSSQRSQQASLQIPAYWSGKKSCSKFSSARRIESNHRKNGEIEFLGACGGNKGRTGFRSDWQFSDAVDYLVFWNLILIDESVPIRTRTRWMFVSHSSSTKFNFFSSLICFRFFSADKVIIFTQFWARLALAFMSHFFCLHSRMTKHSQSLSLIHESFAVEGTCPASSVPETNEASRLCCRCDGRERKNVRSHLDLFIAVAVVFVIICNLIPSIYCVMDKFVKKNSGNPPPSPTPTKPDVWKQIFYVGVASCWWLVTMLFISFTSWF